MRILIADDDATSRAMLTALLKKGGYEVIVTVNGTDAWEALQQPDAPSMAILDWMMPGIDGLEVMRRVRAHKTDQPPYIIMLTAKGEKNDVITGLDAGANDYLTKPFDMGELQARIKVGQRMLELQSELIKSREAMAHEATHDALTGILNRRAILEDLRKEVVRSGRYGDALAIGMCDIDFFKRVNDTYGHQVGDEVLCALTQLMRSQIREYDAVGRMGGEEFLIITPLKPGMSPTTIYERLCTEVSATPIKTSRGPLSITISIGVACARPDSTVDSILERADNALYKAKNAGRNRVVLADC